MAQSNQNEKEFQPRFQINTLNLDVGVFLDAMPDAAFIVDNLGNIVKCNAKFDGVKNKYLSDRDIPNIGDLFQISSYNDFLKENNKLFELKRLEGEAVFFRVNHRPIDQDGTIELITITPEYKKPDPDQVEEKLMPDLGRLIALFDETEIHSIYENVIEIASNFLESSSICIYQAESGFPKLSKVAGTKDENIFPSSVSITDLIRLKGITIWTPDKKVYSEIQRAGRNANLAYVATVSLGDDSAKIGLLVVGDEEKQPAEKINTVLSILGTFISTVLQHRYLISNLLEEQHRDKNSLFQLNQLMESSSEGIIVISPSMKITRINPAAEIMFGYSGWEIIDKEIENILIGPEGLWQSLQDAVKGIPTHDLGNVNLHRRNGQSFPALVQIIPVLQGKELLDIIIFIRDVSEFEQNRIRTQQLEHRALLGVFTAIFAHEVRNPINNISTGLQLLSSSLHPTDPNQDLVNRIQGDCGRLTQLMESVLAFSRPIETKFEKIDLRFLLHKILDRWNPRLTRLGIELFFNYEENLPPIQGNSRALDQVFTNLISNAVEAMQDSGGILGVQLKRVVTASKKTWVEISISDNGHGIPDEIKDRIFEPFVTTGQRGTGLGLAITKNIITAHRGSINLNSFPGGTVFQIHLLAVEGEKDS